MKPYLYDIESAWFDRPESAAVVGEKFLRTLDALERIDPSFRNWGAPDDPDLTSPGLKVDTVRQDIGAYVQANVARNDWDEPEPSGGFVLLAISNHTSNTPGAPTDAAFFVQAGSAFTNHYAFEIGSNVAPPDLAFITYEIYRPALLALISIWPAPWANVRCAIWGGDPPTWPGEPPFPYSGYQMPWLSYLCADRAARVAVPPEVITERTPDGGLLMISAEERFDPTNRDHMRRARLMAQIMIEHGGDPDS